MFILKERRKDFRPSANFKGLEKSPRKLMSRDSDLDKEREAELKYLQPPPKDMLIDAETGESLTVTKARWTTTEGRLSLNAKTIIDMGTGKLDVRSRVHEQIRAMSPPKSVHSSLTATKDGASSGKLMHSPLRSAGSLVSLHVDMHRPVSIVTTTAESLITLNNGLEKRQTPDVNEINAILSFSSSSSRNCQPHPLVAEFLEKGPLTPIMHNLWDPRTNTVIFGDASLSEDEHSIASGSSTSVALMNSLSVSADPSGPNTGTVSPVVEKVEYKLGDYNIIPKTIELNRQRNWNAILEKTFIELYNYAERLELNKSLTGENRIPGGLPGVRKVCQDLAKIKVKYMKELIQAIDDEAKKEEKRELYEFENREKESFLVTVKKKHLEERMKGKQYIEALRRDQEIVFMHRMKEAGLLW